jgi:hypothetical protein
MREGKIAAEFDDVRGVSERHVFDIAAAESGGQVS